MLIAAGAFIKNRCGDYYHHDDADDDFIDSSSTACSKYADHFHQFFRGWQQMAKFSSGQATGGTTQKKLCRTDDELYFCLVDWKFNPGLQSRQQKGSASDADIDAAKALVMMAVEETFCNNNSREFRRKKIYRNIDLNIKK